MRPSTEAPNLGYGFSLNRYRKGYLLSCERFIKFVDRIRLFISRTIPLVFPSKLINGNERKLTELFLRGSRKNYIILRESVSLGRDRTGRELFPLMM